VNLPCSSSDNPALIDADTGYHNTLEETKTQTATITLPGTVTSTNLQNSFVGPLEFRGLPKAGPRKERRAPRRKGKSIIATDTPNKQEIEEREAKKCRKRKMAARTTKRKVLQETSSEDDEQMSVYSEVEHWIEEEDEAVDSITFTVLKSLPREGSFVIVEFKVKEKEIYYVGKVIGGKENDSEISFLRRSDKNQNNFFMPNNPDIAMVALTDIKMILPQPKLSGSTKRKQGMYYFDMDFTNINLR
jgi:hypothetical protein